MGVLSELMDLLKTSGLGCTEVPLRRDYVRGETKRGLILTAGALEPRDTQVITQDN